MLRVNGLFGWISHNDRRSATLFLGFILIFQALMALGLFIPLALFDHDHAPVVNWTGYAVRYLPLATAAGALLFYAHFRGHIEAIRRQSDFRYVFKGDEPRLCRIIEPLAIAAGLPEPRLAIIESPALNAFACGVGPSKAVLVFTRGLIDGLDDEELAAVAAHELTHIKNGDVRLIAAANACIRSFAWLVNEKAADRKHLQQAFSLPALLLFMPSLFVFFAVFLFVRQSCINFGVLTRRMISAAREFIADAEAVQLTQNPAALVSALNKVNGRSHVADLPAEQDAMMIDGPCAGALATHPSIADRIAAIVKVTGSMVYNSPARRDTRGAPMGGMRGGGMRGGARAGAPVFGRRKSAPAAGGMNQSDAAARIAQSAQDILLSHETTRAAQSASPVVVRNMFGMTREMTICTILGIVVYLFIHRADLANPGKLGAEFNVMELAVISKVVGSKLTCIPKKFAELSVGAKNSDECKRGATDDLVYNYKGSLSFMGKWMLERRDPEDDMAPGFVKAKLVLQDRCFITRHYTVGERGLHTANERSGHGASEISLSRYLGYVANSVQRVKDSDAKQYDDNLRSYVKTRKSMIETIHLFFGKPGLDIAQSAYAAVAHDTIIEKIKNRLTDPKFSETLSPLERAEYELLTKTPNEFITCIARKQA